MAAAQLVVPHHCGPRCSIAAWIHQASHLREPCAHHVPQLLGECPSCELWRLAAGQHAALHAVQVLGRLAPEIGGE
eukprot:11164450-Alexandrium_andersonii.AAC.1